MLIKLVLPYTKAFYSSHCTKITFQMNLQCQFSCNQMRKYSMSWALVQDIMRDRVEELRKAVEAAEQNRQAAMRALAEERQRSLELQVKISRQVLKNSMFFLCARSCTIRFVC